MLHQLTSASLLKIGELVNKLASSQLSCQSKDVDISEDKRRIEAKEVEL